MSTHTRTIHKVLCGLVLSASISIFSALSPAQDNPRPTLTGKLYVAEMEGTASIKNRDKIEPLAKKTSHDAEGSSLVTKPDSLTALVLSNGVGLALDASTELEVRRFVQEPFAPNRTDLEAEPSVSHTSLFVSQGTVSLYTGTLTAGSTFNINSRHGSVTIRGKEVVVEVTDDQMIISLLVGDVTVSGDSKIAGQSLLPGQQAVITRDPAGGPSKVVIRDIPVEKVKTLEQKVDLAEMARKTVLFDVTTGKGDVITPVEVLPGTLSSPVTVSPFKLP
ncbi:MAG: FecR domain-containing protein [Rariglobus sp.]|nr:FecR domain-containing protein [Rariglobus sp.]